MRRYFEELNHDKCQRKAGVLSLNSTYWIEILGSSRLQVFLLYGNSNVMFDIFAA